MNMRMFAFMHNHTKIAQPVQYHLSLKDIRVESMLALEFVVLQSCHCSHCRSSELVDRHILFAIRQIWLIVVFAFAIVRIHAQTYQCSSSCSIICLYRTSDKNQYWPINLLLCRLIIVVIAIAVYQLTDIHHFAIGKGFHLLLECATGIII